MSIRLYNTMRRKKEEFKPRVEGKVNIYVCGPTVYNYISIGNSRPIVVFDMVRNYFRYRGYEVILVQNITDIEDKIINKANEEGVDHKVITERYIKAFREDLENLEIGSIDHMPLATGMIDQIIDVIQRIIKNGYGYEMDGNVYFDVAKFDGYGKLSGQKIEEVKDSEDTGFEKRNRIDFALWKKAREGEPSWDSPWGKGRPGWHIECSAMSTDILDHNIDIHGGGLDLVFPHHENEIAQSEAAFPGREFSSYWMHNGMIEVRSEKMSKSRGLKQDWILRNLLVKYPPDVIKLYMLSTHYRSPLEFSGTKLEEAAKALERINNTLGNLDFLASSAPVKDGDEEDLAGRIEAVTDGLRDGFEAAMDDDFNSARAIGEIFDTVREMNTIIQDPGFIISSDIRESLGKVRDMIIKLTGVLGLRLSSRTEAGDESISGEEIESMIEKRNQARQERDFAEADKIRDVLLSRGIVLEDRKEGTIWKVKD